MRRRSLSRFFISLIAGLLGSPLGQNVAAAQDYPPPAFVSAGGQAQLVMERPFGEEGHFVFPDVRGLDLWPATVKSFLNGLGIYDHKASQKINYQR